MTFTDWLANRLGSRRWVIARRSPKLSSKYDVFLSQKGFSALKAEFESL